MIETVVLGVAGALLGVYVIQPVVLWLLDNM